MRGVRRGLRQEAGTEERHRQEQARRAQGGDRGAAEERKHAEIRGETIQDDSR